MKKGKKIRGLGLGDIADTFLYALSFPPGTKLPHRKTALKYEGKNLIVDTCLATDTKVWETGVLDERYCDFISEEWIIVDQYENKENAEKGHKNWIKLLTSKNPPKRIYDIFSEECFKLKKEK